MRKLITIAALAMIVIAFRTPASAACVGGVWTPQAVSLLDGGTSRAPAFHTIWGYACRGTIYMMRFSNQVGTPPAIAADIIGRTPVPCADTGRWSPDPLSKREEGAPNTPTFHTVWAYECSGTMYMIRFGNQISQPPAVKVDIIGQFPVQ